MIRWTKSNISETVVRSHWMPCHPENMDQVILFSPEFSDHRTYSWKPVVERRRTHGSSIQGHSIPSNSSERHAVPWFAITSKTERDKQDGLHSKRNSTFSTSSLVSSTWSLTNSDINVLPTLRFVCNVIRSNTKEREIRIWTMRIVREDQRMEERRRVKKKKRGVPTPMHHLGRPCYDERERTSEGRLRMHLIDPTSKSGSMSALFLLQQVDATWISDMHKRILTLR